MVLVLANVRQRFSRGLAQQGEYYFPTGVLAYFTGRVRCDNASSGVCSHLFISANVLPIGANPVGE